MSVTDFYNQLSPFFHLIYADWEASILLQASQIDSIIREFWGQKTRTILDAACGVGTQAIGLAQIGYQVTASDLSSGPIERAKGEAARRGLRIDFRTADMRTLSQSYKQTFDLVIACDNAVPHLLTDDEIRDAFMEMARCTVPGGGCLISVRDYDPAESRGVKIVPYGMRSEAGRRFLVFQVWEFDGPTYDLSMYFVEDRGDQDCITHVMRSKYYAVPVSRLLELMKEAGFHQVQRIDGRFFQPLILGVKPV